jgi:hypothetical protein
VLVHGSPQPADLALDDDAHLIQVPSLAVCRAATLDLESDLRGELEVLLAQGFVTHGDATLEKDLLHDSQAQGEAVELPQGVVDHGVGKAIPVISSGRGEISGHCLELTRHPSS